MPLDWAPFVEIVRRHQRFVLTTHVRPDGDGLGSMQALAGGLRREGKEVRTFIASVLPARYQFLDPDGRIERFAPPGGDVVAEVAVVLDTGTWNQLADFGPFLRKSNAVKVVIDHHLTQDDLGAVHFVDTSAEATGRLVYEALAALGGPLPAGAADQLFVALATDTGWFRHSNASAATFALADRLVQAGARPAALYENLFENGTLGRLKLIGLMLERLQVTHGGRLAYSEIHKEDYAVTQATPQDTEELVNYSLSLAGVEIGLLLMEQPRGGVKVSFRSRGADVARLAEQFGGGGHRFASGATLMGTLEEARARVLPAAAAALGG